MKRIQNLWQGLVLRGRFWRLYWNSATGAGIYEQGRKREFSPGCIYLLAPDCHLETWCSNPEVVQLYIHFEAMQYLGNQQELCMECPLTNAQREHLDKIIAVSQSEEEVWRYNLLGLALVAETLTSFPPELLNEQKADDRFVKVCHFMRMHFNEELSLEDLSRQVNMAPNAFARKFKQLYLTTPYQYLLHLRYVQAARLLMTRRMTLKEIATDVGIRDSYQLSRGFKAVYGVSPALFQRQSTVASRLGTLEAQPENHRQV